MKLLTEFKNSKKILKGWGLKERISFVLMRCWCRLKYRIHCKYLFTPVSNLVGMREDTFGYVSRGMLLHKDYTMRGIILKIIGRLV